MISRAVYHSTFEVLLCGLCDIIVPIEGKSTVCAQSEVV